MVSDEYPRMIVAWLGSGVGSGVDVGAGVGDGVGSGVGVGVGVSSGSSDGSGVGEGAWLTGTWDSSSLGSGSSDGSVLGATLTASDGSTLGDSDGTSLTATLSDDFGVSAVPSDEDAIMAAPMQAAIATTNGMSICFCFRLKNFMPNTMAHIKATTQAKEKKVCISYHYSLLCSIKRTF